MKISAFLITLALLGSSAVTQAQTLTGFGSSDTNPFNATNILPPWTATIGTSTVSVSGVNAGGGGLQEIFSTGITVTNPIQNLTLSGTLQAAPAGNKNFVIVIYDSTLLDSLSYQFQWTNFSLTDSYTGTLLTGASVGTFNGVVGAWELDPAGSPTDTVSFTFNNLAYTATAVPEPSTYAMLGAGLVALYFFGRRRAKVRVRA